MDIIIKFVLVLLSAMTLENILFTRAIGVDRSTLKIKTPKLILMFGGITTVMLTASVVINGLLVWALGRFLSTGFAKNILYFAAAVITYLLAVAISRYIGSDFYNKVKRMLILTMFSGCVYGTILITSIQTGGIIYSIGYAIGSGAGFTIALFLIYMGKERISILEVPKAFQGVPIIMLYLGILSLAIYGLIGHQLPS